MTTSTLRMIEDMGGLDTYLLSTPEAKLKSDAASAVKWEVITALRAREHRERTLLRAQPQPQQPQQQQQ
ncbi:hypothetical protein GPECTOR_36g1 [Gonium pectorale]|uniref:Uncharacterized protein n=1 Tax=Gonium pectorale TaxID=33097 RepID=A0A150GBM8_GONPE|nr:hypothetical protein GPECTOR_36g1 [Gonium pectorale]|eukprot:KXZ47244.1 hypothetical protein GPECTOR_36g1 [Gonium pectorale]